MEIVISLEPQILDDISRRIKFLQDILSNCNNDSECEMTESLLIDYAAEIEIKVNKMMSEWSYLCCLSTNNLDRLFENLKNELNMIESESSKISNEIEVLARTHVEETMVIEGDIERLKCSLNFISLMVLDEAIDVSGIKTVHNGKPPPLLNAQEHEIVEIYMQIESSKLILQALQDFNTTLQILDATEQIENSLSGLKVIECDGSSVRLSLQTHVPFLKGQLCLPMMKDLPEQSVTHHELLFEVLNGFIQLKNAEIFPNDVYIGHIIDEAMSSRKMLSNWALMETKSSFHRFIRKVQNRIMHCTLRRQLVKSANNLRHSFEYLDRDETVVSRFVGVDVFFRIPQGWPLMEVPLTVISTKSSDHHFNDISLSSNRKIQEAANSMEAHMRQNFSSFADVVEELLGKQVHAKTQHALQK